MNEVFEKIFERLEKEKNKDRIGVYSEIQCDAIKFAYGSAKEIVQEVAEKYNNGWIPVSERLPEEAFGCLVTVMDCEPSTQTDFENILPYFVGYDGHGWNDADGEEIPFEVIAWQPLPEPYTKG